VLLSIQERASGDLTLIMRQGKTMTAHSAFLRKEAEIMESRCSLHVSPQSPDINVLKYTYVLGNGQKRIARNYTKAIKISRRFAPLLFVRSDGLTQQRLIARPEGDNIMLASFDPEAFMMFYAVYVGPPDKRFTWYGPPMDPMGASETHHPLVLYGAPGFCLKQICFAKFSLIFLWNFMAHPSLDISSNVHPETLDDAGILSINDEYWKRLYIEKALGIEEPLAVALFHHMNALLREHLFTTMEIDHPHIAPQLISSMRLMASFFQFPSLTTPEFVRHLSLCSIFMDREHPFFPELHNTG
jgi:hypothetical protein